MRVLERIEGLAEHFAFVSVGGRQVEGQLRRSERAAGADQAFFRQTLHEVFETLARQAEHIGFRHFHVVEEQLGGVLGFLAHLHEIAAALETVHAALDQEQGHVMGIVLRVGLGRHDHQIGIDAVGDIGLGAVQQPMVTAVFGVGAHTGQIAAGIGFGHGDGEDGFALHAARQKAHALFFVTKTCQVGAHQTAVQGVIPIADAGVGGFFQDDLLEAEVVVAHAAVFFVGPHHQIAFGAGFQEGLAVDDALFAPTLHVRHDFGGQEAAIGRAEHDLFFGEVAGQHGVSL